MEIAEVRKRVRDTMARARAHAQEHRARSDQAAAQYARFLAGVAVPVCRQLVSVLRAEGYPFMLATPVASVALVSERSPSDAIELVLETEGQHPMIIGRTRRRHGGRVLESERPVNERGEIGALTEEDVLTFLLQELEPFVAK